MTGAIALTVCIRLGSWRAVVRVGSSVWTTAICASNFMDWPDVKTTGKSVLSGPVISIIGFMSVHFEKSINPGYPAGTVPQPVRISATVIVTSIKRMAI